MSSEEGPRHFFNLPLHHCPIVSKYTGKATTSNKKKEETPNQTITKEEFYLRKKIPQNKIDQFIKNLEIKRTIEVTD